MHSLHCAIRVFTRCVISQSNWDFILRSYGYGLAIFVDCQALLESERGKKKSKGARHILGKRQKSVCNELREDGMHRHGGQLRQRRLEEISQPLRKRWKLDIC